MKKSKFKRLSAWVLSMTMVGAMPVRVLAYYSDDEDLYGDSC